MNKAAQGSAGRPPRRGRSARRPEPLSRKVSNVSHQRRLRKLKSGAAQAPLRGDSSSDSHPGRPKSGPPAHRESCQRENAAQEIPVNLGRAEADLIPGSQRIQRQENRAVVRARKKERPTVRSRLVAEKRRGENGSRR